MLGDDRTGDRRERRQGPRLVAEMVSRGQAPVVTPGSGELDSKQRRGCRGLGGPQGLAGWAAAAFSQGTGHHSREGTLSSGCKGPQRRDHPLTGPPGHEKAAGQDPWWRQEHTVVTPGGQGPARVT